MASGRAIKGSQAAISPSPRPKPTADMTMKKMPSATSPGPTHIRPSVPNTQASVLVIRNGFLRPRASAAAPASGPRIITTAAAKETAMVKARVAQGLPAATVDTK